MTTLGELKTKVSLALRDTDNDVFDLPTVASFIDAAMAEVGRIAPQRFQEDITPVADALSYVVRSDEFAGEEQAEIELVRVELWDGSQTPMRPLRLIQPQAAEQVRYSNAGWVLWGGRLELPLRTVDMIDGHEDDYLIRVWGYSPYPPMDSDDDIVPLSAELEECVVLFCFIESLRRLIGSRVLFTQWQTRSNASDVSPASLMNDLSLANEEWRRKSRAVFVLREAP